MISSIINDEGAPIEVAPGLGDLRRSSVPWVLNLRRSVRMVDRQVSFAMLFAEQPLVAGVAGWFMRQQRRVPLKTYRRTGDDSRERLRPADSKVAAAIESPWERGSALDLTANLLGPFLVHGSSLTEIDSGARETLRFVPADWRFARPIMPWRDTIAGWDLDCDSSETERTRGADVVLHVKDWSPLGPMGLSPLQQLGVTLAIEDAAQRHQREGLRNGVRTATAVTMEESFLGLKPEEREELMSGLRADIEADMAGPPNSGRPWLVPPGLSIEKVGQTAQEAELIEQRVVGRTEALAVYGLPPAAAAVIERGSELPEQRQMAYVDGLGPPLILVEACINAQLVRGLLNDTETFVEYDFSGILRGDRLKEVEALRYAIGSALTTPNEGRSVLNLPQSDQPGMDSFYLPRNNLWPTDVPYEATGMTSDE